MSKKRIARKKIGIFKCVMYSSDLSTEYAALVPTGELSCQSVESNFVVSNA